MLFLQAYSLQLSSLGTLYEDACVLEVIPEVS